MERIRLEIGRVVAALPYHNHYLVRFLGEIGTVTAVAIDGTGAVRSGAKAGQAYMPGSAVFGVVFTENHPAYKFFATPRLILGALAEFPLHKDNTNIVPRDIVLDSLSGYNQNKLYRNIINNEKAPTFNQDRSYNRATDSVPGDWYKSTPMGGTILLSDFLTRIGASERCFLDFNALNDELSGQLDSMDLDAELARLRVLNYGDLGMRVESDALNRSEGLGGVLGGAPFLTPGDADIDARVEPWYEDQKGFFRHETFAGGLVNGFMRTIKTDALATGENGLVRGDVAHRNGDVTYPGLIKEDVRFDGVYGLQAAKEIFLTKRFLIQVPYEVETEVNNQEPNTSETSYPAQFGPNREGEEGRGDALPLQSKEGWKLPLYADLREIVGEIPDTVAPLEEEAPAYTLEDIASILLEVYPGRKIRLFKNTSVFLMADEGSIRITDGFKSEILMENGNITISCPGDIIQKPGRDSIEWVPRNKLIKSRQRMELSSTEDTVAIKADRDIKMLSGNSGFGSTVIENRGVDEKLTNFTGENLRAGGAIGAGVHIRSRNAGVSLLGNYIYGGGYTNQTASENGIISSGCNILLDAGPGVLLAKGRTAALQGGQSASVSMDATTAGIYVTPSITSIAANAQITQTAPLVYMGRGGQSVDKPFVNRDGIQTQRATIPNTLTSLVVEGVGTIGGGLQVRGSISATGGVVANDGTGPPLIPNSVSVLLPTVDVSPAITFPSRDIENLYAYLVEDIGVHTEYGHAILDFAFPDSEGSVYYAGQFKNENTPWQAIVDTEAVWVEREVAHAIVEEGSMPYPGIKHWLDEERGLDEYKINTSS